MGSQIGTLGSKVNTVAGVANNALTYSTDALTYGRDARGLAEQARQQAARADVKAGTALGRASTALNKAATAIGESKLAQRLARAATAALNRVEAALSVLTNAFRILDGKMGGVLSKLASLAGKVLAIANMVATIFSVIATLASLAQLYQLTQQVNAQERKIAEQGRLIDQIQRIIASIRSELASLRGVATDALNNSINALSRAASALSQSSSAISTANSALNSAINAASIAAAAAAAAAAASAIANAAIRQAQNAYNTANNAINKANQALNAANKQPRTIVRQTNNYIDRTITKIDRRQFIERIEGKPGKDGKDGVNGLNGKDGKDVNPADLADIKQMLRRIDSTTTRTEIVSSIVMSDTTQVKAKVGGIEGVLNGLNSFTQKAFRATRMDKVLNALNFILLLHNAAMLSRNLASTLGDLTSQALSVIGIKDENDSPIDINSILSKKADEFMSGILGEETWKGTKESWNKANRIVSSATNILWTVRSMTDSVREIGEWTAENTGKIGNALKRYRIVGEDAYKWMPENVRATNRWTARVDKFMEGTDSLDDAASSLSGVLGEVQNIQEEAKQLKEQKETFKKQKACLHKEDDSLLLTVGRMNLFLYATTYLTDRYPVVAGSLLDEIDGKISYRPKITLFFRENAEDAEAGYKPVEMECSFRLVDETTQTITESKLRTLANKIKTQFGTGNGYVFRKGRKLILYRDKSKGYSFLLRARELSDGKALIREILSLNGDTLDPEILQVSERENETGAFPYNPGFQTILGKRKSKPRRRPMVSVKFRHAYATIHGYNKPVYLYSKHSYIPDVLVAA